MEGSLQARPVFRYAGRSNVDDFRAITKQADIIELSKQPEIRENAPQLAVFDDSIPGLDEGDFVRDVSAPITIGVIADMLGVPQADRQPLFRWTNEVIAPNDPESQTGSAQDTLERARLELRTMFARLRERLESIELAGTVDLMRSSFVGGIKRAPMRREIRKS